MSLMSVAPVSNFPPLLHTFKNSAVHPIKNLFSTIIQHAPLIIENVRNVVGIARLVFDIDYIVNARYKFEHTLFGILGSCSIAISDFTSIFFCLDSWKILTFANIAGFMGTFQTLKPLLEVPFGLLFGCLASFGYVFIFIDSVYRLAPSDQSDIQKRQALLDVINSVAQLALAVGFVVGVTQLYILIPLAACAALFGVISFFHRWHVSQNTFWAPAMK